MSYASTKRNSSFLCALTIMCTVTIQQMLPAMEKKPITTITTPASVSAPRSPSIVRLSFAPDKSHILHILLTNGALSDADVSTGKITPGTPGIMAPDQVARISKKSQLLIFDKPEDGHQLDEKLHINRSYMNNRTSNCLYTATIADDTDHKQVKCGHDCQLREVWFDDLSVWPTGEQQPRRNIAIYLKDEEKS